MSYRIDVDLILPKLDITSEDVSKILDIASITALRMIDLAFKRQGPGWQPLKPRTLLRRRQLGKGAKILQDTGRLKNSQVVQRKTSDTVEMGSNLVYAATHQYGRGPIPARPFLPTEDELVAQIVPKVQRYLDAR